MANVRVIRIDDIGGSENIQVSSYEDAFEGFSNANGSKRRNKKLQRIKGRQEIDSTRNEAKDSRQQNKIGRKSNRKKSRQAIRQDKKNIGQENRQGRLDNRKQRSVDRKDYGREEEEMVDDTMTQDNSQEQGGDYSQQEDSRGYEDNSQQDNGGYADEPQYEQSPSRNTDDYRQDSLENASDEEEETQYEDEGGHESDFNEEYGSLNGIDERNVIVEVEKVPKPVLDAVKSINDHKNRIAILTDEKAKGKTELPQLFCKFDGENDDIDAMINTSKARVVDLEGKVESYISANGESARKNVAIAQRYCKAKRKNRPTFVKPNLNAQIGKQKIVVPAQKSSFDAVDTDGRVHPSYEIDIDGTQGRLFDIYSNADGSSGNSDIIKPILFGAVISVGVILFVNHFKLLK